MSEFTGKDFNDTSVVIDGNDYIQCTFTGCTLLYRGGIIPKFAGCRLDRCRWVFEDSAIRTIGLLRGMYSGLGAGGRQIVDDFIREIRTPFPKQGN